MIFAAVCPEVLDIFYKTPQDQFPKVILPESVSEEALLAFAEYMYNGVLNLDPDLLLQMKVIAQHLNMEYFEKLCNTQLKSLLPQNNPPSQAEPMLREPCLSSGLIEEAELEGNSVLEIAPDQNDTLTADSMAMENSDVLPLSDLPLDDCEGTDRNEIEDVDNNLAFSADNDNFNDMISMPIMEVEKVESGNHEVIKI